VEAGVLRIAGSVDNARCDLWPDQTALDDVLVTAAHEEQRKHPDATVEIWAMDEQRIGLKPTVRGVWAPVGERPIALGHHRFEWLYVTGFVEPASGRTVWNIANAVCKEMFELVLADFAKSVGAGPTKRIVLQLDNRECCRDRGPHHLLTRARTRQRLWEAAEFSQL